MESKKFNLDKYKTIGLLRPGYKTATKITYTDRRGSHQTDHFDGRRDAHIVATPMKVGSKVKERRSG